MVKLVLSRAIVKKFIRINPNKKFSQNYYIRIEEVLKARKEE